MTHFSTIWREISMPNRNHSKKRTRTCHHNWRTTLIDVMADAIDDEDMLETTVDLMATILQADWDDEGLTDLLCLAAATFTTLLEEDLEEKNNNLPRRRRNPDPIGMDPLESNWAQMLVAGCMAGCQGAGWEDGC